MDEKTLQEGQEYSNNTIDLMGDLVKKAEDLGDNDEERENAYDSINEFGLSLSHEKIYNYLISWGGPSFRIQFIVKDNEIIKANPQYQDWFTQWETMETTEEQQKIIVDFLYCLFGTDLEMLPNEEDNN
jgi:hypothetical protein